MDWDRPADMCRHIYRNKEKASTNITLGRLMAYNSESIMGPFPNCRGHSLLTPWAGVWINLVCEYFLWEEEERQTRGRKPEWGLLAALVDSQIMEKAPLHVHRSQVNSSPCCAGVKRCFSVTCGEDRKAP